MSASTLGIRPSLSRVRNRKVSSSFLDSLNLSQTHLENSNQNERCLPVYIRKILKILANFATKYLLSGNYPFRKNGFKMLHNYLHWWIIYFFQAWDCSFWILSDRFLNEHTFTLVRSHGLFYQLLHINFMN